MGDRGRSRGRMKLQFDEVGDATTINQLEQFSKRYQIVLPSEYLSFLLQANGGYPEDELVFPTGEVDDSSVLSHFYGLDPKCDDVLNLCECYETFVQSGAISSEYLPIADDAFGNQICIQIGSHENGRIVFWNHENSKISIIAESFNEFLASLTILEE